MRKKAIGQIIVCSIMAVILTIALLASIVLFRGYNGTLPISGKVTEFLQNDSLIQEAAEAAKNAFESLPTPRLKLIGCAPIITFSPDGDGEYLGRVPEGYEQGAGSYSTMPDSIKISWASGRIFLVPSDEVTGVEIYEYTGDVVLGSLSSLPASDVPEDRVLIRSMSGRTLKIEEFRQGFTLSALDGDYEKTLVVLVSAKDFSELKIESASAKVFVSGLSLNKLDLDTAAGDVEVNACTINDLEVDSASNTATFKACDIRSIDLDSASGIFRFELTTTPDKIDVDAMSGSYRFVLPKDASFKVDMDALAGSLSTPGFSATLISGNTVVGSGSSRFDFDLVSGEIVLEAAGGSEGTSF